MGFYEQELTFLWETQNHLHCSLLLRSESTSAEKKHFKQALMYRCSGFEGTSCKDGNLLCAGQGASGAERHRKALLGVHFKTILFKAQQGILPLCAVICLPNQKVLLSNEIENGHI